MIRLGVNIDHVATVRQARRSTYPDILTAAALAERGGADGITVHLREDRRHIQDADVDALRRNVRTKLNLEMAPVPEMVEKACSVRPDDVCLVPERREELTTEGGLDVVGQRELLREVLRRLRATGIRVSLFVDPVPDQIRAARELEAEAVELHTGAYAEASGEQRRHELERLRRAAAEARRLGLEVHAGHGLNLENVRPVAAIPEVVELNIGHSIVARALFVGLEEAVREMKVAIAAARK
ncbi:MAG: pyridoxine 5'-phosphate synthase [Candidatus Binatia bacterium]|nr:MAG: pyridoxine 5'-phosphate synthase [Candidatus Binatia bacterium]